MPRDRLQEARNAYQAGILGRSVKDLSLRGLSPLEATERLYRRGFRPRRLPIPAHTNHKAQAQWRLANGGVTLAGNDSADLATELVFVHADGGVVRFLPGTIAGFEVASGPWARKSVLAESPGDRIPDDLSIRREAFVVSAGASEPIPKTPRAEHGMLSTPDDPVASYELARFALARSVSPLGEGPSPRFPLHHGARGIVRRFTIVVKGDFAAIARDLERRVRGPSWSVIPRREWGDVRLYFAGSRRVAALLRDEPRLPALASVRIHYGAYVVSVDAFGTEASAAELTRFVTPILGGADWPVIDDASSGDLTPLARRVPSLLLAADDPDDNVDLDA